MLAEAGGEQQLGGGVGGEGDEEGGGGCGIRSDEFEPGEAEQSGGGGPLAEPGGEGAVGAAAAQGPGEQAVHGAERVEQAPDGAEEEEAGTSPTQRRT